MGLIILAVIILIAFIIIITNIAVVQQSRAYVIERLGAFHSVWGVGLHSPWREWELRSRDQEIDYAAAHNIPIPVSHDHDYSMDRNMWHLSHEGSDLEDPWNAPKDELFIVTNIPEKAPDKPEYVELEYVEGVPVSVNGEKLSRSEEHTSELQSRI